MKIVTIIGARPQFIKAAAVSRAISLNGKISEIIIHTGQHFDKNMSEIFFSDMKIPQPKYNLKINNLGHGAMTGRMIEEIEKVLIHEKPEWLLIYGDTNSTLAGALAASKLHIPIAHVEAGLRSFNMNMPEEINRIVADRLSSLLLCPTLSAVDNLNREGFSNFNCRIECIGDVMLDATMLFGPHARKPMFSIPDKYIVCTVHRAENTDNPARLKGILDALISISARVPVIFPIHPRTNKIILNNYPELLKNYSNFQFTEPLGYLEMMYLTQHCQCVITDSGGLQKEAFFHKKPCITVRDETEWTELTLNGYNQVVGTDTNKIIEAFSRIANHRLSFEEHFYGDGKACDRILNLLLK